MSSLIKLLLSLSVLSTAYASVCLDTCIAVAAGFDCQGNLECACADRSKFEGNMASCIAPNPACTSQDLKDMQKVCDGVGTSPTTNSPPETAPTTLSKDPDPQAPATSTQAPDTSQTLPSETTKSSSPSTISATRSISNSLSANTPPSSVSNTFPTAFVAPRDERLAYAPSSAWADATAETGCSNGAHSSSTPGSSVSFTFTGTAIWFSTLPLDTSGNWSISLDNQMAEVISGANDQFTNPSGCHTFIPYKKERLTNTRHTIVATLQDGGPVKRATNSMYFAGFVYQGPNASDTPSPVTPSSSTNPAVIGGAVAGAVALISILAVSAWVIRTRRRRVDKRKGAGTGTPDVCPERVMAARPVPPERLRSEKGRGGVTAAGGFPSPSVVLPAGGWQTKRGHHGAVEGSISEGNGGSSTAADPPANLSFSQQQAPQAPVQLFQPRARRIQDIPSFMHESEAPPPAYSQD